MHRYAMKLVLAEVRHQKRQGDRQELERTHALEPNPAQRDREKSDREREQEVPHTRVAHRNPLATVAFAKGKGRLRLHSLILAPPQYSTNWLTIGDPRR